MRPTLAPPPNAPPTVPDLDRSPLGRYLLHPQRTLAAGARTLAHHAAETIHRDGLWLLVLAVALLAARLAVARRAATGWRPAGRDPPTTPGRPRRRSGPVAQPRRATAPTPAAPGPPPR